MNNQNETAIETGSISLNVEPNRIGSLWESVEPLHASKYAGLSRNVD